MSSSQNTYNVLIQLKSQNDAEKIISLFRGAGIAVRAHRITSEQDFKEQLEENWDLLVVDNRHPEVSLPFNIDTLKAKKIDLPIILATDDYSPETLERAFKMGIQDVIDNKADAHFVFAARREMNNAKERRRARELEKDYKELSERAEQLLSESDDAIAYVSDGIIMHANELFAQTFCYDLDDLDCASIIDLVDSQDQERFKNFFRHFAKGEMAQTELAFNGVKFDGDTFEAFMTLTNSTLDGEPCTQMNITTASAGGEGSVSGSGTLDAATELYNRYYLADQAVSAALQVSKGISNASLLVYALDDFNNLLDDLRLSGIDALIKDLATHLQGQLSTGEVIARLTDNSVAVIMQQSPEEALAKAKSTLKTIEEHICELEGRTVQYTCTCGVLHLNNKDPIAMLDGAIEAIGSIRLNGKERNSAQIYTPAVKEAPKPGADDVADIEEAIELGVFKLLYQPMMSLQGDQRENYEATLWMEDKEELVYPESLIKGAKNSKLDRWIILEATKALSLHRANGHDTRLTVNLTMNALMDGGLAPWLGVAIKAANLSNEMLVFQFKEEDIRNNLKAAIKTLTALSGAGFKVSVCDFGKEADPFKLLKHVKLDLVRIDAHFTETISSGDTGDLKELIKNAKENEIKTILPEVDNAGALATLWQLGTHYIQGSYLQQPSPVMNYEFTEIA